MRVGPLPNGHVLLTLDDEQMEQARDIAEQRERVPRVGRKAQREAKGRKTHLEGALAEIAVAAFYDAPYEGHTGSTDGGIDFTLGTWTVQVKSRPHSPHYRVGHMSIAEWDHLTARVFFQTITHMQTSPYSVELVGFATLERVKETPIEDIETRSGNVVPLRRIREDTLSLVSPDAIMDAMHRFSKERDKSDAPPVPRAWGNRDTPDPDDEARCKALQGVVDVPGGVIVSAYDPPVRGTLISALATLPGFPPGVRVVLDHEPEIVRKSDTRNNPTGTPIARNFTSAEVRIA